MMTPGMAALVGVGAFGSELVTDTNDRRGNWCLMQAVTDTTFDILESSDMANIGAFVTNGYVLYAGATLRATITRVKMVTGGAVILFNNP